MKMLRVTTAAVLLAAGVVWSVGFPKKATLEFDQVLSVGIAVGLICTGMIVLYANRIRWQTAVLSTLLLWSLVANAYLLAWQRQAVDLFLSLALDSPNGPVQTDRPSAGG